MKWTCIKENGVPPKKCGPVLVTNNIDARDANGNMSHVWVNNTGLMFSNDGDEWNCFVGEGRIYNVTHYIVIGVPGTSAKRSGKKKGGD